MMCLFDVCLMEFSLLKYSHYFLHLNIFQNVTMIISNEIQIFLFESENNQLNSTIALSKHNCKYSQLLKSKLLSIYTLRLHLNPFYPSILSLLRIILQFGAVFSMVSIVSVSIAQLTIHHVLTIVELMHLNLNW